MMLDAWLFLLFKTNQVSFYISSLVGRTKYICHYYTAYVNGSMIQLITSGSIAFDSINISTDTGN